MKILYIATSFPEPNKGGTIYTDLAEALQEAGHEVTVAVSEQSRNKKHTELIKERGFDVLRVVTGNYYDVGFIEKGITSLKIPILMRKGIKRYLTKKKFDFILFEAPPITNVGLISWAKKRYRCPAYLMLKDIFPQNAVDLGIVKKNGFIYKYFKIKEKNLFYASDYIGCMSPENKKYLLNQNPFIDEGKVELFPNTVKIIDNIFQEESSIREQYGISKETCVFLFGGNMGRPQYIDFLSEVIYQCRNEENMYFLFIGRGTDRYILEDKIKENNIKNALIISNLPRSQYEQFTKECDIGLIVLDPRFTIPNYPSRVLSYMQFAKPVIAATDLVSDFKDLIKEAQCGEWVWSGDLTTFVAKAKEMAKSERLKDMGNNGRIYLENNFDVKRSVEILESHFN